MYYVCPQEHTIGVHISSWCPQNPAANFNLSVQNRCLCLWSNQCGVHQPSAVILIKPSVSVNSHIRLTKHRWNSVHLVARPFLFANEIARCFARYGYEIFVVDIEQCLAGNVPFSLWQFAKDVRFKNTDTAVYIWQQKYPPRHKYEEFRSARNMTIEPVTVERRTTRSQVDMMNNRTTSECLSLRSQRYNSMWCSRKAVEHEHKLTVFNFMLKVGYWLIQKNVKIPKYCTNTACSASHQ